MVTGSLSGSIAVLGGVMAGLSGCTQPPEPAPTVSWFEQHPQDLRAKLTWCADDVPRQQRAECLNAATAQGRQRLGTMKDEPALNWNSPDSKQP